MQPKRDERCDNGQGIHSRPHYLSMYTSLLRRLLCARRSVATVFSAATVNFVVVVSSMSPNTARLTHNTTTTTRRRRQRQYQAAGTPTYRYVSLTLCDTLPRPRTQESYPPVPRQAPLPLLYPLSLSALTAAPLITHHPTHIHLPDPTFPTLSPSQPCRPPPLSVRASTT